MKSNLLVQFADRKMPLCVVIAMLVGLMGITVQAQWLSGYELRKSLPINAGSGAGIGYQIQVRVGESSGASSFDLHAGNNALNFPNDVRFTDDDGTTELSHWLETTTGVAPNRTATFWVKVNDSLDSAQSIFVYYKKSAGASGSNGDTTFSFFDDFPGAAIDTTKWTIDNATGWTVTGGELRGQNTSGRIRSTNTFSSGVILETKYRNVARASNGSMALGFWISNADAFGWLNHPTTDYYRNNGAWTAIGATVTVPVFARITTLATQADLHVYRQSDGVTLQSNLVANTVAGERITLGQRYDNANTGQAYDAFWDWVRVRKNATTFPTLGSAGSEQSESLFVSVVAPANGQAFVVGSSISATVTVRSGTAPYSVTLYTNSGVAWTTNGTTNTSFTINLGAPGLGTYTNYATVIDATNGTATSSTSTFNVVSNNIGSGGTITYTDSSGLNPRSSPPYPFGYVVHTFTGSGTYSNPSAVNAEVLVVAGGGGGAGNGASSEHCMGSGGAGGLIFSNSYSVGVGSTTVTVGSGGSGGSQGNSPTGDNAGNGGNSVFGTLTATGGGAGRQTTAGVNGGSGGGAGAWGGSRTGGSAFPAGQGNNGGNSTTGAGNHSGGGGGSASAGGNSTGVGGNGTSYSISGASVTYAAGGSHGGGSALANTGNGGGGALANQAGGSGGSGIVIIRYPFNGGIAVDVTVPINGQQFAVGSSISATVRVANGTAPYSVTFYTNSGVAWTTNGATTNLFTINLGVLPLGTYSNFATVTDSGSFGATSSTNTFSVTIPNTFFWTNSVSGVWSGAANWTNSIGGVAAPAASGQADYALSFNRNGPAFTANNDLNSGFLLNQLNFGGATVTVAGASLVFTNNGGVLPQINQNSPASITVSNDIALGANLTVGGSGTGVVTLAGVMSSEGSLTKAGTHRLEIATVSTYSGPTAIRSGTLNVGSNGSLGAGNYSSAISNDAEFLYSSSSNQTLSGVISGTGMVTVAGTSTLTLNGTNTYTGPTTIRGGTLSIADSGSLGSGIYGGIITNNGAFLYSSSSNQTLSGDIRGTGTVTKSGASTLTLSGSNHYTGLTTINAGILKLQGFAFLATNRVYSISSGGELNLDGNTGIPANTTTVSGAGTLRISGGQLGNGIGAGRNLAMTMSSGGVIIVQSGASIYNGGWQSFNWTNNKASLTMDGSFDFADGQNVFVDAFNGSGTIDKSQAAGGTIILNVGVTNGSGTFSGTIKNTQAAIAFTKSGTGTQVLTGTNNYTGATTVNNGTLTLAGSRTVAGGAVVVGNGGIATLNIQGDLPFAGNNQLQVGGITTGIVNHTSGTVTFNAGNNLELLIGNGTGIPGHGIYNLSGSGVMNIGAGVASRGIMLGANGGASASDRKVAAFNMSGGTVNNANTLMIVRGDFPSSFYRASFTQTGGTASNQALVMGGSLNSGSGSTADLSLTGGTFVATAFSSLSLGHAVTSTITIAGTADVTLGAFPQSRGTGSAADLILDGGVLRPAIASATYMSGLRSANIRAGGATFDVPSGRDITVGQSLLEDPVSIGGGLTKTGVGILTLANSNGFTGGLIIKAGTVSGTTSSNAFGGNGVGTITIGDSSGSANATLSGGQATTYSNAISIASGNSGVASISSSANAVFAGGVTLNTHDLRVAPAASTIELRGGVAGIGNLLLGTTGAGTITMSTTALSFAGGITNNGAGSGLTTISAGIGSSVTNINQNSTASALTISGALTVNSTATKLINTAGSSLLTLSGGTTGSGNLELLNNSATAQGVTLTTTAVGHTGTITNRGAGSGSVTIIGGVGASVDRIDEASSSSALTINTTALTVNSAVTKLINSGAGSAVLTLSSGTIGTGNLELQNNSSAVGGITISGTTANHTGSITNSGSGSGEVQISAVIGTSVTGVTQNSSSSPLSLSGPNTFTGPLNVLAGTVKLGNATAAGGGRVTLGIASDATSGILDLNGGARTVAALSTAGTAANQLIGNSAATPGTLNLTGPNISTYGGVIQNVLGSGSSYTAVTLSNTAANLTFSGSSANTYTGLTLVAAGNLFLAKSGSANAIAGGGLTIGSSNNTAATVKYTGTSSDMMGAGTVTINGRGIFDFNGKSDTIGNVVIDSTGASGDDITAITNTAGGGSLTIGSLGITPVAGLTTIVDPGVGTTLTLGGNVTFTAASSGQGRITGTELALGVSTRTFTIGLGTGPGYDLLVDAPISGASIGLTKDGAGRLALTGVNTYSGPTAVNAGTLFINSPGSLDDGSSVIVGSAGTLGGNGIINGTVNVSADGTLAPGTSAIGTLTLADNSASALILNGSSLSFELPTSGTNCDLVAVSGSIVLNGVNTVYVNAPGGAAAGTYTVMTFANRTGAGSLVFQNGFTTMGNLTLSNEATRVTVSVGAGGFAPPVWKGVVDGNWDTTTANWFKNGLSGQTYADGDQVLFDNTASSFIVTNGVGATLLPTSVAVTGALNYIISANIGGVGTKIIKRGSSQLTLSGTNTYTGETEIYAGTLVTSNGSNLGSGGGIIINGSATWNAGGAVSVTYDHSLTINDNAVLTVNSGNAGKTITGVFRGNGAIVNSSTTGFDFPNTGNTFTGRVNSGYAMSFASLGDSTNSINLNNSNSQFIWIGGAKTFALRPFTLNLPLASSSSGKIINNGSGALTILEDLAITGPSGARTLELGGNNSGVNRFTGTIANGTGAVVSLNKAGTGNWALSGTNTYSGTTTMNFVNPNSGLLIFQGMQSLSPNTSLAQTHGGGTGGHGTFRLLDDSATPASRTTVNLIFNHANNSQNAISLFVGNNNNANGGNSFGTTTGSVIQLGSMNFNQTAAGQVNGTALSVSGANGYKLQLANVNVSLQAGFAGAWPAKLLAGMSIIVTGTVQQVAGGGGTTTLQLDGSATESLISGVILNSADGSPKSLNVTKLSAGTWTLSGANTYTGVTTVSGGTLIITSIDNAANPNPLGQSSTAAANLVLGDGTTLKYTGGAASTDRGFTLTGASATIDASGTGPVSFANTASPAFGTSGQTRTLVLTGSNTETNTLAASIADNAAAVSITKNGIGTWVLTGNSTYSGTPAIQSGTLLVLANAPAGSSGAFGNSASDVTLGVASANNNASILIGGAFEVGRNIRILTADGTDAGARTLTLGGNTAHNSTFSGNIFLGTASQAGRGLTLTAAAGGQVTFAGVIQDPAGMDATAYTVTKAGLGTVVLTNVNTFSGGTLVSAGTLRLAAGGSINNSTNIDIGAGGTLDVSTLTVAATRGAGQTLQASGSTSGGTLLTAASKGMTLNSTSPIKFTAFKPSGSGGAVPLTVSGAGTLTLGASSPVTITVSNNGIPLSSSGSPYKLIAKSAGGTVATLPGGALTINGDGVSGSPSLSLVGGELFLDVAGASAYKIEVAGGTNSTVTAGASINLTVTALDGAGATLTSLTRDLSLSFYGLSSSPGGTAPTVSDKNGVSRTITTTAGVPNVTLSFVNGVATISGTSNGVARAYNATGSPVTLHCSDGSTSSASGIGAAGLNLTVNAASANRLGFGVQPSATAAGSAISPAVTVLVQDTYGNTVSGDSGSVTISSGNTAFTASTLSVNAVSSVATFNNIKPTTSGIGRTLTASRVGLTSATSSGFTVSPVAAATLSLTSGNNQSGSASAPLGSPFVVTARDVYGNPVAGVTVDFLIDTVPGGAVDQSLSAASPTTAANGQASSTLTMGNLAGTYTVTASSTGLSGSPVTFTATVAPLPIGYTNLAAGTWSTDGNWANASAPPIGGGSTAKIVMNESGDGTSINDLGGALTLNQIVQVANTRLDLIGSGGSSLSFTNNALLLPSIRNENTMDSGRFAIYLPITLATNLTISSDSSSGPISLHSNITETAVSSLNVSMLNANNANGAATFTLGGSNSFSGGTTVNSGYLSIGADAGLGAVPSSPKTNLTLNGAKLISSNSIALHANRSIRLGSGGGSIGGGGGNSITVSGQISGPGALNVLRPSLNSFSLILNGANTYQGVTTIGSTNTTAVTLQLGNNSALPGTGLIFDGNAAATLDMRGFNATVGALTAVNNLAIVDIVSGGGNSILTVGNGNSSSTFEGLIRNTSGTLHLTKIGSGTLTLNNTNAYAGSTTISGGTLAIGLSNSIATSSNISIAAGATLDVSALGAGGIFALGTNAALTAGGTGTNVGTTAATIKANASGTNSLGNRPITLNFTPTAFNGDNTHPSLLVSQGVLDLTNNVVTINNVTATPLGAGTYTVIRATSGTINGTPNATPVVIGTGLEGDSVGMLSVSGGDVNLIVVATPTDLALSMSQSTDLTNVGSAMSYVITVSNAGPVLSSPTTLSNILGYTVGYVSSSAGGTHNAGVVTWALPALATGATTSLTLNVTASLAQGPFTNRAFISMSNRGDPVMGNNSTSLVAQSQCAGAPTPFIASPGNKTVYVSNLLTFAVVSSNVDCATPFLFVGGKPSAATFNTVTNGYVTTGTFSWTPTAADAGTHPVRFFASNTGSGTNSVNILIYVATNGESVNGSGVPLSQVNWHVVITNISVPEVGSSIVKWSSVSGVTYDLYTATNNYGQSTMTWTKEVNAAVALGPEQTGIISSAIQKYVQVVPAGFTPGSENLWAVIKPSITPGFSLFSAPVSGSDLKMNGSFGTNLALVLTGHNGGTGDYTGDEVFILNGDGSYSNLYLDASGVWRTSGGSAATHQLTAGQGILVMRNSISSVQPRFSGPVGNTLINTNTINPGVTVLTFSEGKYLTPSAAFSSLVSGIPVGDYDENSADQIIFVDADGSFRPVQRLPDGTWLDLTTFGSAGHLFTPGRAAFYIRQTSGGTMKVRF